MLKNRNPFPRNRRLAAAAALLLALGGSVLAFPSAALADQPDFICEDLDSGKIDTTGDPATVEYTAPDGYLVDYYCVKAGTEKFIVEVDPDAKTVVIDHPTKDSVSHYSVKWIAETPPPDDVCSNLDGVQETVPDGYTLTEGECTIPPDDVCANLDGVQETVPEGMVADGANCIEKKYFICHATPADTAAEGWNYIEVSVNAIVGSAPNQNGNDGHTEHSADILPAIPGILPGGQNLDTVYAGGVTGAQLLTDELACAPPTPPDCEASSGLRSLTHDDCTATAEISFGEPSCSAYGALELGSTEHASFGDPVIVGGTYSVVAYADEGYNFEPGEGVSDDGETRTFAGDLPPKLTGAACGSIVVPTLATTPATCFTNGTYTLGGTDVQWSEGGNPVASGLHSLATGASVDLTVVPVAPNTFAEGQQTEFHVAFVAPRYSCDLTTLALTGSGPEPTGLVWVGAFAILWGIMLVFSARRMTRRS